MITYFALFFAVVAAAGWIYAAHLEDKVEMMQAQIDYMGSQITPPIKRMGLRGEDLLP